MRMAISVDATYILGEYFKKCSDFYEIMNIEDVYEAMMYLICNEILNIGMLETLSTYLGNSEISKRDMVTVLENYYTGKEYRRLSNIFKTVQVIHDIRYINNNTFRIEYE